MNILQQIKNYKFGSLTIKILPALLIVCSISTISNAQVSGLFNEARDQIYNLISLFASFIVAPIAVGALIVLLAQVIMALISGESNKIGQKLGWIALCIVVAGVCFWIGINARTVFNQ